MITYIKDLTVFKYLKKLVGNSAYYSPFSPNTRLKENSNVCFYKMKYSSINYYYSAWINRDSYINIAELSFSPFIQNSITESNIRVIRITIDYKAFEKYGDILFMSLLDMMIVI